MESVRRDKLLWNSLTEVIERGDLWIISHEIIALTYLGVLQLY